MKDMVNKIRNKTISEISAKKDLNKLNELKNAGITKQKKRTTKQKELSNLFNNLLDTILTDKTPKSKSQEDDENENEDKNVNENENENVNENDETLMPSDKDNDYDDENKNKNENEDDDETMSKTK